MPRSSQARRTKRPDVGGFLIRDETTKYQRSIRQCLELADKVADPATAARLKKLAEVYRERLERFLQDAKD